MLRMITFNEAKSILALDSISPYDNNRDIWKSQAIAYGATLNSPYNQNEWALNRLLPVDVAIKQKIKITWQRVDGTVITVSRADVGSIIQVPSEASTYASGVTNFDGWYTNPGDQPLVIGTTTAPSTNVVYKAKEQTLYTIIFYNDDYNAGTGTGTVVETRNNVSSNTIITRPSPDPTPTNPQQGYSYSLDKWILIDGVGNKQLGKQIKKASDLGVPGTYKFMPVYNGEDLPDNHVKIFDNIGKTPVRHSDDPNKTQPAHSAVGDIGGYWDYNTYGDGWYSGPMDGHDDDVCGKDGGISPTGSATGRQLITKNAITYTAYDADSIVYEFLVITPGDYEHGDVARISGSQAYKTISDLSSDDLISEWTGYDSSGNTILRIKSNKSWIKFAMIAVLDPYAIPTPAPPLYQPISFIDPSGQETALTINNIPISVQIVYFVADNGDNASRVGTVTANVYGTNYDKTNCIYVSSQINPHTGQAYTDTPWTDRSYMTSGNVYFYQLGQTYTPVNL